MSFEPEQYPSVDQPQYMPPRKRRTWPWIVVIVILILLGSGGWFAWSNPGTVLQFVARGSSENSAGNSDSSQFADLLASQQKTGEDLDNLNKMISDQKDQLKTLSDQVAALTSAVDALQHPAAPAQPAPPVAAVQPPAPAGAARPKPRRVSRPAGAVSVGGAPLNAGTH